MAVWLYGYASAVEFGDLKKGGYQSFFNGETVSFTDHNHVIEVPINSEGESEYMAATPDGLLLFGWQMSEDGKRYIIQENVPASSYSLKHGCLSGEPIKDIEKIKDYSKNNLRL
ncbi:hypothetical protein [uncultured Vibrio sp.]|uniref:hypothetical protein n=1 Tax=uncultured Vibrio sp. TaxID=114054 RepID=UPI002611DF0A|nr:hypothetical protein [uncultured Vibrio sp.]